MTGMQRGFLAFSGIGLLFSTPALADVKDGVDAWTRGDYTAAVGQWKGPAESGDADAQFNLAQAYKLGRGVKQDLAKAEELFGKAADHGHMQASDNYGLLLFQRGERAKAMPYLIAASDRGDPRAQYLLGIAHFNGDNVPKDWVRAYALVSLAQQAGLSQASGALAQMDQHIPLEQRQQSVALAQELSQQAEATRARQLASAGLGNSIPGSPTPPPPVEVNSQPAPVITAQSVPPRIATMRTVPSATQSSSPREAGADFTRPKPAAPVKTAKSPAIAATPRTAPAPAPRAAAVPAPASSGSWRIQLGAFGIAGNAEALWNRVKSRPEVSGHAKALVPGGSVTRLQATGYASEDAAKSACSRLTSAGFDCRVVRN
jgi:cell division septation protein DedD